jgi:methylmalonyl-CoA/ethylmalonyl-CoA epimerase
MADHAPLLEKIDQVSIPVRDLDRALAFYRDTLELPFLFRTDQLAFLICGGIRLLLSRPESPEFDHPGSVVYYRVTDIRQAYETLKARGVAFRGEPHVIGRLGNAEVWMAFFSDPEGNVLALSSEVLPA